jgi:SAM-dependent methyltransferase
MRFVDKLGKLFNGSAWASATNTYYSWVYPVDPKQILSGIDLKGLERIREKYGIPGETTHWPKYLHTDHWLRVNIRRAQDLRLASRPGPLRILDLGSGAGYFLLAARQLGHSGMGLDIPDPPMYGKLFELFGLKRVISEIKAFEPLPDLGERFDLITAFAICFNGHRRSDLWTSKEWAFFLNDLETRFLKPGGEIFLAVNAEEDGSFYAPALRRFFIERGAKIDRPKVWFRGVGAEAKEKAKGRWIIAGGPATSSMRPHRSAGSA